MIRRIGIPLFFLSLSLLFLHPINSGDFFHYLNTGRDIIQNGSLPYLDTWSFTANGRPWVAHAWGAGVIFYFVYSLFGPNGISVLFMLLGLSCGIFLFLILKKIAISSSVALVFVFIASSLISLRWPTRPEVLGPLFIIMLVYFLLDFQKKSFFLIPFFWLWGIIYGSSLFLGVAVFAFYLTTKRVFDKKSLAIFFFSIIASLLNGYGLRSFLYIFQIPSIASYVGEWLPLHKTLDPRFPDLVLFYQNIVLSYMLFVILSLIILIIALVKFRQTLFSNLFLLGLFLTLFAPFYTNRFINLAPLIVVPIVALLITSMSKKIRYMFLLFLVVLALFTTIVQFKTFTFGMGLENNPFQTKVTNYIRNHGIKGNIFASQEIGGFLTWELPNSKVFVDTRDDLYAPLGIFQELQSISEGKASLLGLLKKHQASIIIADLGSASFYKDAIYSENWKLVYLTDGYFLMLRKDVFDKHTLGSFDAIDPSRIPPSKSGTLEKAEIQIQALLQKDPTSIENQIRLAELKLGLKKPHEAKEIVERLELSGHFGARQSIVDMESAILRGKVYLANNECDKAYEALDKAEQLSHGQFLFFLKLRLPTTVDKYLGEYYADCKDDKSRARYYLEQYLQETQNPIERRMIEQKLEML